MRFGYKASSEQFGPVDLLRYSVLAEECGFDSVFIADHLQPWRHEGGHAPAAIPWLSALGARTERILIGTSVLTPTLRYHPAVIAQEFATLGCLYPGRVILGVGTGEALNESAIGVHWPELKERFARLREAVRLIRTLWAEERVDFEGDFYSTNGATIYDRPEQQVPIYVGSAGPATTRWAGRTADGFITTSGKGQELYTETLLPSLAEGAEKTGRDVGQIDKMIEMKVSFDTDADRALHDTRFWAPLSLTQEEKHSVQDPQEMQRLADALPIERVAKRWIVSSDPDEHVQMVQQYIDWGFNHLVFHGPGHDQERFLKLYGKEILPRLRAQNS
ncbi:MAG: glucose-6-phosphate dehydrogenase (coenzyme-F420) [Propionibacterium sp.]|nr:glucose-6-phosphate dehydrogenase (coenzyme-F420) [Propionibacterium sp.]